MAFEDLRADEPVVLTRFPNSLAVGPLNTVDGTLGRLVAIDRTHVTVSGLAASFQRGCSVGHHVMNARPESRVIGIVAQITIEEDKGDHTAQIVNILIELIGEIRPDGAGHDQYFRGLRHYPELGAPCSAISARDLTTIYAFHAKNGIEIGRLSNNQTIPALINVNELLTRHFAVMGSTGTGKTTGVALVMRRCLAEVENLRVLILDPHNEYRDHFPDNSILLTANNLEIPFWMFRFEELSDIIYSGRRPSADESDALHDVIRSARIRYAQHLNVAPTTLRRSANAETANISADTPTPFRINDAMNIIDEWMGQLERRYSINDLRALRNRLELLARDPRYKFMFQTALIEDNMHEIIAKIFRIPQEDKPVCIVELGGLPNEVVNSVVSVLGRLAFEISFWSGGRYDICIICEEAHRYVPRDLHLGFGPTRQSLGRIAKEGRKYGVSLGIITQRPAEVDPTVLSQCSTLFAMRMPNDTDKAIIRNALSEYSASLVGILPSIADREAIAFGEAIPTPMRMTFSESQRVSNPNARLQGLSAAGQGESMARIVAHLRGEHTS